MSDLAICDHFGWTLNDLRDLDLVEYYHAVRYIKKIVDSRKKAARKRKW